MSKKRYLFTAVAVILCAACLCVLFAGCGGENEMTDDDAAALSAAIRNSLSYTGSYYFEWTIDESTETSASGLTKSETEHDICSYDADNSIYYISVYMESLTSVYQEEEMYFKKNDDVRYDTYLYYDVGGSVQRIMTDGSIVASALEVTTFSYLLDGYSDASVFAVCDSIAKLTLAFAELCDGGLLNVSATVSGPKNNRTYTLTNSVSSIDSSKTTLDTYTYTFTVKNELLAGMTTEKSSYEYSDFATTSTVREELVFGYKYDASLAKTHFSDLSLFAEAASV